MLLFRPTGAHRLLSSLCFETAEILGEQQEYASQAHRPFLNVINAALHGTVLASHSSLDPEIKQAEALVKRTRLSPHHMNIQDQILPSFVQDETNTRTYSVS